MNPASNSSSISCILALLLVIPNHQETISVTKLKWQQINFHQEYIVSCLLFHAYLTPTSSLSHFQTNAGELERIKLNTCTWFWIHVLILAMKILYLKFTATILYQNLNLIKINNRCIWYTLPRWQRSRIFFLYSNVSSNVHKLSTPLPPFPSHWSRDIIRTVPSAVWRLIGSL